ncbi:MAG TPA: phosphoenolpyruvate carboxykinase (ATP) [Dehalococcoidia bacterium]|nr:phosphoenolpyruvate carboxykinase (ATP) [Dehalococcoidia bacterium]
MPKFDLQQFARTVERIRTKALAENRLRHNPSDDELERLAESEPSVRRTKYGNLVAESEPTSRAAMFTHNSVDHPFGRAERELLTQAEEVLSQKKLISIDRIVGNRDSNTVVRLTVPEEFAHVAFGGKNLFVATRGEVKQPAYEIVMFYDEAFERNKSKPLPEKDITIRLAMLEDGRVIKIVRNSNYIGEYKKGVFASEDWVVKTRRGGIFLHAGCREDFLQSSHGDYRTTRSLLAALSANGKTTTTGRALARKGREQSWLVQDDGGTLMPDGSFHGFELGGLYVKTENVNPGEQEEIYYGLLRPTTFGENISVGDDGDFDFYDVATTSNGRAVIQRRDFMHASPFIDVERVDNLILITRQPSMPALAKLTVQQAAAFMVLGQAMESSAGDPTRAGRIRTEFFYDPFVAGSRAEHANRFYEILRGLPNMQYYILNTGSISQGNSYLDIKLEHTLGILDSLLRGGLEDWVASPTGLQVPAAVRAVDDIYFHPERLCSMAEFEEEITAINRFRRESIEKIGDTLHSHIRKVFE